nr:immunoglobulin light chain junction region [Macaca mulatta]
CAAWDETLSGYIF